MEELVLVVHTHETWVIYSHPETSVFITLRLCTVPILSLFVLAFFHFICHFAELNFKQPPRRHQHQQRRDGKIANRFTLLCKDIFHVNLTNSEWLHIQYSSMCAPLCGFVL